MGGRFNRCASLLSSRRHSSSEYYMSPVATLFRFNARLISYCFDYFGARLISWYSEFSLSEASSPLAPDLDYDYVHLPFFLEVPPTLLPFFFTWLPPSAAIVVKPSVAVSARGWRRLYGTFLLPFFSYVTVGISSLPELSST